MKKLSILVLFIFSLLEVAVAQTPSEFSKEPQKFISDVSGYLNNTKKEECKKAADDFNSLYKSGKITPDQMNIVINTSNALLKRNLTAYPYFSGYLITVSNILNSSQGAEFFKNWSNILDQVIAAQRPGDNNRFLNYLNFTDGLVVEGMLYSGTNKHWYVENKNVQLLFDNGEPKVVVPQNTTLRGTVTGDTILITNTMGTYYPLRNHWEGKGGRTDWGRAGMDPSGVYAIFSNYSIEFNKQEYLVDTVDFYFTLFFSKPIKGSFQDKMITNSKIENATYPRFISYDEHIKINNLADNVTYEGAFNLFGSKIYGSGKSGGKAVLTFYIPGTKTVALVARGEDITIRKPVELNFQNAEIELYFGSDSIYHPSVDLNYKIAKKELRISRGKDGEKGRSFYDSYHKTEIAVDAITWDLTKSYINMMMEEGAGQKLSRISSNNYYNPNTIRAVQGTADYNPLSKLKIYLDGKKTDTIAAATFCKLLSPNLTVEQTLPLIYKMAEEGFISYDNDNQVIKVLEKNSNYVIDQSGRRDFDNISFGALSKTLKDPIGVINLKNYNIDFNGVKMVPISDSAQVVFFPLHDSLKLQKNRDMEFSGMILAARLDLHGQGYRFNYDPFNVELKRVDTMILNIPVPDGRLDENNDPVLTPMNSKIEKLEGLLEVDFPKNKSGRSPLKQFPMLTSAKNSYVYYDQNRILNGVYTRDRFYFMNDPFKMDSLRYFDVNGMYFDGQLFSANIFPPYKEQIAKMPDYSLGFKSVVPMAGFTCYQNHGKYTGNLKLDLDGLRGTGKVEYLSATLNCPEIIFYPDSMITKAEQFTIAKTTTGVSTPATSAKNTPIKWTPYQDEMAIGRGDSAFQMYDDKTTFDGSLTLGKKGLFGNGKLEWEEATLASTKIKFQADDLEADTSSLQIKSIAGNRVTFITPNVHAKVDFKNRFGRFVSNVKDIPTDFAYNQYKTAINEFDWDMDKKILDFRSPKESPGSYFISTKPEQFDLKFLAKRGIYDLQSSIMYLEQVPEIIIADSRVIPDSGKVVIEPEAKMRTLNNCKIKGDTINSFQTIEHATVDIQSSRSLTGTGSYTYKMKDGKEEKIKIAELKVDSKTEEVDRKNTLTKYFVHAKGSIEESANFTLYPEMKYKGDVNFFTKDKDVTFNGYSYINFKNPRVKTSWFSVNQTIDPKRLELHFSEPKSPEGNSVLAGIALNNRDSAGMYTLILGSKVAKNDENVFDARGVMIHNETTGEYIFGDSGRVLGNDEFGNIMRYNDNTGAVNCDGKVNLGIDFGAVENTATGLITTNVNEDNKYNFDLSLGLNLEFSKDINEKLASLFLQDFENGDLDNSTDKFSKQIKNLMDEKEAKKFFEDLTKNSTATKPKNFNFNLLLSDTKFVFDPAEMTYRSKGPIGMVFYGEKSILKKMDGYIEFGAQRSSGYFNIYLKSSLGDWLFITYKSSNVTFLSSYDDLNALITGVDPEKRKVTRDNGKFYIYALGSQTKMKAFVERMKALNSK